MEQLVQYIIYDSSYIELYGIVFIYFLLLYFGLGSSYLYVCKWLESKGTMHKISTSKLTEGQVSYEVKHSFVSLLIFGFSAFPIIYLIRLGHVDLLDNNLLNTIIGIVLLTLWNEVHFFVIHRIMHFKWFMKHIHFIHHKSKVPTVYSVYSFHWLEAVLLSTVPLTIVPFIPFSPFAIALYPLASILLNFAGHSNYRIGDGTVMKLIGYSTRHNDHHSRGKKNYGFASNLLDKLNDLF